VKLEKVCPKPPGKPADAVEIPIIEQVEPLLQVAVGIFTVPAAKVTPADV
jgi:hypothetical protein